MSDLEIFVLSAALGADLFSAAVPIGMAGFNCNRLRIIEASLVFALFHIVMILAGYYAGDWLGRVVEDLGKAHVSWRMISVENGAKIIGALVLALLGLYMILEKSFHSKSQSCPALTNPLQGLALFMLAFSMSIDALAAGFSLGMIDVSLVRLSLILGAVIFTISVTGLVLGRRAGGCFGERAGLVGGLVLMLLGVHVLWTLYS